MTDVLPQFLQLIAALNNAQVRYVLIGGVAMRLHGSSQFTDDIDLCYARDIANLHALTDTLKEYHPSLRGAPDDLPFVLDIRAFKFSQNFTLKTDIGSIDLLGDTPGAPAFDVLYLRAAEVVVHNQTVRVASLDDLIAMKRAANRPKDQMHIMELEQLKRLIQENG